MHISPMNFEIIFILSQIEPFSLISPNMVDLTGLKKEKQKEITLKCRFWKHTRLGYVSF